MALLVAGNKAKNLDSIGPIADPFLFYFIDLIANVKQVLSIVVAVTVFNTKIGFLNGLGIIMTLFGGACYRCDSSLDRFSLHVIKPFSAS